MAPTSDTGERAGVDGADGAPIRRRLRRPSPAVLLLAALAYLPALTAAPGRMPADSKLYLYLDPLRLIGDAFHSFDQRQFAGWVPHQHISFLWPSGPWFAVFETLGVPDWVAHRLWLGTLLFAAGLGVRWVGRLLGLSACGALAAAIVYQFSPYLLPYSSRTSVMLLPWAGLGWIVGLTMLAALGNRWRHTAAVALVVFTVGAVNATALVMIVPAPALWLVHAAWSGGITWRRAAVTAARISALCIAVSLWWVTAAVIQGRHGADVLAYSETLEAVSFTSSSTEVLRGLGYWLFYVRDPMAAATTASIDHLTSGRTVLAGIVLLMVGVVGIAAVRWSQRRYAALLVAAGVILAVGVHPIDDRSPLMALLVGDTRAGLALALRSSTRAVPVSLLGLALGAGALVTALGASGARRFAGRPRERWAAATVVVLAVVNLPASWSGGLVDPALERDQDLPRAWLDAAEHLDALPDGYRVLQLPGAEFGAFRWGFTVDQPLPGMTDRPLVTRDLLPLGSPAAMDLLYALDDRVQLGVLDPAALVPVARLLGVDTIWLANDLAFERYRTARTDVVADLVRSAPGVAGTTAFGDPVPNVPAVPTVDETELVLGGVRPLPPVELVDLADPVGVIRAKDRSVVLSGSGDGVVDAAAAGLVDGTELLRYSASIDAGDLAGALASAELVVVTDSNRARARHWRSSQDTLGFTEEGTDSPPVLTEDTADQRLPVFDDPPDNTRTVAVQVGPVTARASAYGEPFAYRPEDRAVMAVDGDPATAWRVADRFDAVGEHIELTVTGSSTTAGATSAVLTVRQPDAHEGARRISEVDVAVTDQEPVRVALDERSTSGPGQAVPLPRAVGPGDTVTVTIASTTADPSSPDAFAAVGFAELDLGFGPTLEVVRPPSDVLVAAPVGTPVAVVLTRERVDPLDRWRSDPEPAMVRSLTSTTTRVLQPEVTVRIDRRATDDVLAALVGVATVVADERLTGAPTSGGWAAVDGDLGTDWTSAFGGGVGTRLTLPVDGTLGPLVLHQPTDSAHSTITGVRLTGADGRTADVAVPAPDATGRSDLARAPVDGPIDAPITGPEVTLEITGIASLTTVDRRYGETVVLPVAITEITGPGLAPAPLPEVVDTGCRDDLVTIDGEPFALRVIGQLDELLAGLPATVEPCGSDTLTLDAGEHLLRTASGAATGLQVDRVVLTSAESGERIPGTGPVATVVDHSPTARTVRVEGCPAGCWLVLGEGFGTGWSATTDAGSLGPPQLVDGGFNGWQLPPSEEPVVVSFDWTPQPLLTASLLLSALAALGCLALVVVDRRRRAPVALDQPRVFHGGTTTGRRSLVAVTVVWAVVAGVVVQPLWSLAALGVGAALVALGSPRVAAWVGVAVVSVTGLLVVSRVVRFRPFPDAGWVLAFSDLHRPGLFAVTALAASVLVTDRGETWPASQPTSQQGTQPAEQEPQPTSHAGDPPPR